MIWQLKVALKELEWEFVHKNMYDLLFNSSEIRIFQKQ